MFEVLLKIKCYEISEVIAGDKEIKNDPDSIVCRLPKEVTRTKS